MKKLDEKELIKSVKHSANKKAANTEKNCSV